MLTLLEVRSTPNVFGASPGFLSGEPLPRKGVALPGMSSEATVTWSIDSPGRIGMSR